MKAKLFIIFLVIVAVPILVWILMPGQIKYEEVKLEELDKTVQNAIEQLSEPNVYFIMKDSIVVLYSNLGKSGMYTYPTAEVVKKRDQLTVKIKSNMAVNDPFVKEVLIAKMSMQRLPDQIEAFYEGQKTNHKIINLNEL
ncbi:MAG: hypothetical protein K0Q73_6953 [Paenibacillus sp.]|jgi:short subunit fatty acids transporter|nr:hypothetical protein [Paenibacillus sp.]